MTQTIRRNTPKENARGRRPVTEDEAHLLFPILFNQEADMALVVVKAATILNDALQAFDRADTHSERARLIIVAEKALAFVKMGKAATTAKIHLSKLNAVERALSARQAIVARETPPPVLPGLPGGRHGTV